jgi:hypothetical protein
MIFEEKAKKFYQTGSDRISTTATDKHIGQKPKRPIFDDFDEKSEKLPQTGSSRISVTVSDRHVGQKPKRSIFDDF